MEIYGNHDFPEGFGRRKGRGTSRNYIESFEARSKQHELYRRNTRANAEVS